MPARLLVRLHPGRTFHADPLSPESKSVGRPYIHGMKFSCKDPET
ncbi:MAG: hypothetical protein AVDCRST_MAG28-936 [uncultured Rubrobacteraceae bacterium]|uniref:Uncharacterized protein n=1 Tax=uncultured Rubrobacteraceae bacterium TaxID=349277 RepID=A0A6J4QTB4_9ACTN|nr:MAG: hypothetical protein AVDCRST_MAG28-936 [uncultured Rubrobacteraceae bacterium]